MNFNKIGLLIALKPVKKLQNVTNIFYIVTMATQMKTLVSKSKQSIIIQNNTLLINFSQIGPVVFIKNLFIIACFQQYGKLGGGNLATK